MSTDVRCPVCIGSSIQCYKCNIKQLKQKICQLEKQLANYDDHILAEKLQIPTPNNIYKIRQSNQKLSNLYSIDNQHMSSYKFITITFDSSKFGMQPLEDYRKNYILYQLYSLYQKDMIKNFYGSFEYHKNGLIHAHIICQTYNPIDVYYYLLSKFTDNTKNKIAVQLDKAKIPNAIDYIEKESTHYFLKVRKATFLNIIELYKKDDSSDDDNPLDVINYNINNY